MHCINLHHKFKTYDKNSILQVEYYADNLLGKSLGRLYLD